MATVFTDCVDSVEFISISIFNDSARDLLECASAAHDSKFRIIIIRKWDWRKSIAGL